LPKLWLVTDEARLKDPMPAIRALPKSSGVVFRHYGDPERAALAEQIGANCRARRLFLMIAADLSLAMRVKAQGVHLPEGLIDKARAIRRARPRFFISASAHGFAAIRRAERAGCDAVVLAPVFATASHPARKPLGPLRFAVLAGRSLLPVIALGGITPGNLRRLQGAKVAGIAGVSLFARA
jgi:thiamine-phosphate pyrophosphorylase